MKSSVDSTDFYISADDNQNYMYEAGKYLDSVKIKQVNKESKGTLLFKTGAGNVFKMNLDTIYWGVILFNGKRKPLIADITDIEVDYKPYMKK